MTDYSELIKKLRDLHRDPRPASAVWLFDNQIALYDAAAAIEGLQAQLPKRGEWVLQASGQDCKCSVCESYWIPFGDEYDYKFCPNCGAKMEVQDDKA